MTARGVPVNLVDSGGLPVTNLAAEGAEPFTVTDVPAMPVTLVDAGGYPVTVLAEDGSLYSSGPSVRLSAFVVAENAANGTTIGTISTSGKPGDWGTSTYTITADPDSKFSITGTALKKNATMNYEAKTSHSVTITDTPSGPYDPIAKAFAISVTNVAPVLSSATDVATGDTTADIGVDTTESNGTIYWVVTRSLTAPTAAQIIQGKNEAGATAPKSGSIAVSATGTKTANVTGLTPDIDDYCAHFVHVETSGTQSNVASGNGFSTTIQIVLSASTIAEDASNGTEIGELSVVGGNGVYEFSITDDPDNVFGVTDDVLDKDGTLDYEAATSHQVTIEADNGIDTPLTRTFTITVTNVAPVLSNATDTKTGQTTADITVDTTETTGTLYWVVSTSGTAPSAAQIIAGQDNSGVAAAAANSVAVASSGTKTVNVTGLTAATAYTAHFVHKEGAPGFLNSNVASGNGFTTDSDSFDPATLNADLWLDPSDLSSLFQLSNGTTAVAADADPVGYIADKGAAAANHFTQATAGARPLYKTSGGLSWLEFDGSNDRLESVTNMSAWITGDVFDVVCAGVVISFGVHDAAIPWANTPFFMDKTNGEMGLVCRSHTGDQMSFFIHDGAVKQTPDSYTANAAFVAHIRHTGGNLSLTQNARTTVTTACGTGPVSGLANPWYLASTYAGGVFGNVKFYGMLARKTIFDATELANIKTYLGAKVGLVL